MQGPRGANDPHGGLDAYERMVNTFTKNAKEYWKMWGPLGEVMVRGVDKWAETQRTYLRWLRESSPNTEDQSPIFSSYPEDAEVEGVAEEVERSNEETQKIVSEGLREAERIARESNREAQRIAREAERDTAEEGEQRSREEMRSNVGESARQSSEVEDREELQAGTTIVSEENRAYTQEPPIEDYDSLNVHQVTQRLGELSVEEIEQLRDYEAKNRNRRSLMERFERRIRAAAKP